MIVTMCVLMCVMAMANDNGKSNNENERKLMK